MHKFAAIEVIFSVRKTDLVNHVAGYIQFNEIETNIGAIFDYLIYFRVPISGVYKFSFVGTSGYPNPAPNVGTNFTMVNVERNRMNSFIISSDNPEEQWHVGNTLSSTWIWNMEKNEKVSFYIPDNTPMTATAQWRIDSY